MLRNPILAVLIFAFPFGFAIASNSEQKPKIDLVSIKKLEKEIESVIAEKKDYDWELLNRAFELSLYYAGFPSDIFYKLRYYVPPDAWKPEPPKAIWSLKRGKIRDAKKAMRFAKYAKILAYTDMRSITKLLISSYEFEGIGTKQSVKIISAREEGFEKLKKEYQQRLQKLENLKNPFADERALAAHAKTIAFVRRELERIKTLENSEKYHPELAEFWSPYAIYSSYYGKFGYKKDLVKTRRKIFLSPKDVWRNFYCGFLVPQDTELAKHILRVQDTPESRAHLKKIEEKERN